MSFRTPRRSVVITANMDTTGTFEMNLALSKVRD